ncbi:MAG TPA: adenylate/guanylate cyclase domain-containing protein [Solirubrobacteraceae bacterium]|nr:adenylate/guanylate cyclase domain-containing protein [Solirubrobacteraceae bacterium]
MSATATVPCAGCGGQTPAGKPFCIHCGAPVHDSCPACGEPAIPGARFCAQCGIPLAPAGAPPAPTAAGPPPAVAQRRLVSVLFADLVGFTSLSEHRDAEEVRDLLSRYFDRCRTLIERYGGTVEKFIGDAVMAVWGTPVAREDDAERAVRAAVSLTGAVASLGEEVGIPSLRVRAGVLTGSAAVEVGAEGEGMVLGDTVNTASRLQAIAAPGTVLVDDVTRRASEAAIDYEDAGEHVVKGRRQPVHAWRALRVVAGVGGARRSAGLEAPFVGRDRELALITEVADDSASRRNARLVTITGDAGAGKSRLLWEFFKYVDGVEELRWWHQGRCLSYGEGVSYWALAEMLRARAGMEEDDTPAREREKLGALIERFVSDERERRLVEPRLAALLGMQERGGGEAADLFSGWRLFFERMADAAPVILAFEDLQWADSGLLDFIDYMLEWSADYPIFILALGRPELDARRPNWGTAARLEALDGEAMLTLLEGLVPGLPPDLAARILDRAEGVPLYAVETVRMLLDRGLLSQQGSRYVVTGTIEDLEVPETLHALVAARLDNLDADERALLQDASVLGISFTAAAVAAVAGRREGEVRHALDILVIKQVLGRDDDRRSGEAGQYHFLQALLRTIALGTLARRDRKARHLAAADHLRGYFQDAPEIAEVLASHYLDAVAADPEAADADAIRRRARETLVTAARRAVSLALGAEARSQFERAATLADDEAERASLLAQAGAAAARTADREGARRLLGQALALLEEGGQVQEAARTRMRLAEVLVSENRLEEARELMDQAREGLDDPEAVAGLAARRAQVAFLRGDFRAAREDAELALSIADPRGLADVIANAAMTKGVALYHDYRVTEAGALMSLSVQVALDNDLGDAALRGFYNLADFRAISGDIAEAIRLVDRGLALARERGDRVWERDLLAQSTQIGVIAGRWDDVLAVIGQLRASGDDESTRVATVAAPFIFAARGQLAELEAYGTTPGPPSEWAELALMEHMRDALVLERTGRPAETLEHLETLAATIVTVNSTSKAFYLTDVIDMALSAGRRDLVAAMIGADPVLSSPIIEYQRARAQALLLAGAGELEPAERLLRDAADRLRPLGVPYLLARCLHSHGSVLGDLDRADEAAVALREARALFAELGAIPWVARCDGLLTPAAATS